jgi:hypothetical protein
MFNTAARSGLSHGTGHATNSTPSRQRTQYCHIHPGHRAASARSAAEADMMAGRIRFPPCSQNVMRKVPTKLFCVTGFAVTAIW